MPNHSARLLPEYLYGVRDRKRTFPRGWARCEPLIPYHRSCIHINDDLWAPVTSSSLRRQILAMRLCDQDTARGKGRYSIGGGIRSWRRRVAQYRSSGMTSSRQECTGSNVPFGAAQQTQGVPACRSSTRAARMISHSALNTAFEFTRIHSFTTMDHRRSTGQWRRSAT
jgi:hypothetical protein